MPPLLLSHFSLVNSICLFKILPKEDSSVQPDSSTQISPVDFWALLVLSDSLEKCFFSFASLQSFLGCFQMEQMNSKLRLHTSRRCDRETNPGSFSFLSILRLPLTRAHGVFSDYLLDHTFLDIYLKEIGSSS